MNITSQPFSKREVQSKDLIAAEVSDRRPREKNVESGIPIVFPRNIIRKALRATAAIGACIFLFNFTDNEIHQAQKCLELPTEVYASIQRNGKFSDAEKKDKIFTQAGWDDLGFSVITEELKLALQHQLHVLDKSDITDTRKMGNLEVSYEGLREVLELLVQRVGTQPNDLHQYLELWQTWGDDQMGNVHFTGYFTPVLKVKKVKDAKYKYPIYAFPKNWKGKLPTRQQIDNEGVFESKNLALAYASNPLDVYFMQLQGSGTVEFLDTKERSLFRYAGENGHRYRNIQWFFKNRDDLSLSNLTPEGIKRFLMKHPEKMDSVLHYDPSYTFFEPKKGLAKGSANVPLMEEISIAADPRYFPLGSVVLAAMPVFENGRITHHEYKILLPQDVGGAIKGAGHVDVYCGNGALGQTRASNLHHYGRMWVLLPKKYEQVAMAE